jgi:hypothetical protein
MSVEWCRLRSVTGSALSLVLVLTAAPSASFSDSLICHPIRSGESAAELARRITGASGNTYQSWFQIMDASSAFVPKSQYDRIRAGWRACIVKEPPRRLTVNVAERTAQSPAPVPAAARSLVGDADLVLVWYANARRLLDGVADADLTNLWMGAAVILALFGWRTLDGYAGRRKAVLVVMSHFAFRFVREFERPLVQRPSEPPLRSRLRLRPGRARLEILLAPSQGRLYPNLSDHKKNVEYDVVRVLRSLSDDSFVPVSLHSQGGWVVVSFRFKADRKHTGVACISSF